MPSLPKHARGFSLPIACVRAALPSASPQCRAFPLASAPPPLPLPNSGASPLLQVQTFSPVPSAVVFPSSARGVPLPRPWRPAPQPLRLSPVLSPGLTSGAWVSAPSPRPSSSGCGVQACGSDDLCGSHCTLLVSVPLLPFSRRL